MFNGQDFNFVLKLETIILQSVEESSNPFNGKLKYLIVECMICAERKGSGMNLQLKRLRLNKGLSQEAVAARLGVKVSRYGTWERGERNMSFSQACEVADILECTLDELAGRDTSDIPVFSDRGQELLNACYENMGQDGRQTLVKVARSMERDTANRIEKERQNPNTQVAAIA